MGIDLTIRDILIFNAKNLRWSGSRILGEEAMAFGA
jgi:hypothetical protein